MRGGEEEEQEEEEEEREEEEEDQEEEDEEDGSLRFGTCSRSPKVRAFFTRALRGHFHTWCENAGAEPRVRK